VAQSSTFDVTAPPRVRDGSLDAAYDYCRGVTREHARSFSFCARFLPPAKQRAIHAVYALCRYVDDVVDRAAAVPDRDPRETLEVWRSKLRDAGPDDHPALRAWRDASATFGIDAALAEELMRGVLMDLTEDRYATYAELQVYCYRVASVVGLMTSEIFGYSDPAALERAVTLGLAMQLTNICRDVGEDAALGRIYLPRDELSRFGVEESAILARRLDDRFVELMRFQIERARRLYADAEPGIALLNRDSRFTVLLSSRLYGRILDHIERNGYDVLSRRAYVPLHLKIAALPAVWIEAKLSYNTHP
jgi:15-cis-phytoene synthase